MIRCVCLIAMLLAVTIGVEASTFDGRRGGHKMEVRPSFEIPEELMLEPLPETGALPTSVDYSHAMPPAQAMGELYASAAWAVAYLKTYWDGQEFGWDFHSADQIFNPAFLYSQMAGRVDDALTLRDLMLLISNRGIPLQSVLPYDESSITTHPDKAAKLNAALYYPAEVHCVDNPTGYNRGHFRTNFLDIEKIKRYLVERGPLVTGVVAIEEFYFTNNPEWEIPTSDNSFTLAQRFVGAHGICVVGYDDTRGPRGAFRFINSWGTAWSERAGENGYGWLGYEYARKMSFDWWGMTDHIGPVTGVFGAVVNSDDASLVLPNVRMRLTGTGGSYYGATDLSGEFILLDVAPGEYTLTVACPWIISAQPASSNLTVPASGIVEINDPISVQWNNGIFVQAPNTNPVPINLGADVSTVVVEAHLPDDYDRVVVTVTDALFPNDTMVSVYRGKIPAQFVYPELGYVTMPCDDVLYVGDGVSTNVDFATDLAWSTNSSNKVFITFSAPAYMTLSGNVKVEFKAASSYPARIITCRVMKQDEMSSPVYDERLYLARDLHRTRYTDEDGWVTFSYNQLYPGRYRVEILDSDFDYRRKVKWVDVDDSDQTLYFRAQLPSLDLTGDGIVNWRDLLQFSVQWFAIPQEDNDDFRRGGVQQSRSR